MPRTHKTLPRLYIDAELKAPGELMLDRDQMHHLVHVLRRAEGDLCVVFNGREGAYLARIAQVRKKQTLLELQECIAAQPAAPDLWLGFAPLKSARLDYMVQKATEMGVATLQPVRTQFTQAARLRTDKMRAHVIDAAQQCEVLNLPRIAPEIVLGALISEWPQAHGGRQLIVADEEHASSSPIERVQALAGQPVGVLIGPEGGFSSKERDMLMQQKFVHPISLGPRILRADTAAVATLALVQATIGDWR